MRVILTPGEIAVATTIAGMRQGINREAGKVNQKAGFQDVMTTELVGTFGELAFCRWSWAYPDLSTHLRAGSPDAMLRGFSFDVKTTRRLEEPMWKLDVRPDKCFDYYVFAIADWATVELAGWVNRDMALAMSARQAGSWVFRKDLQPMTEIEHLRNDPLLVRCTP